MSCVDDGLEDCDLGLGFGLKPGSLMKPEDINSPRLMLFKRIDEKDSGCLGSKDFHDRENVKSMADPMKRSNLLSALLDSNQFLGRRSGSLFRKRDFACDQEIDMLNYELDSVRKQLLSKQQAIKILQQQLKYASLENEQLENKIKWVHGTLIKDFNNLQFSMERERLVTSEGREMLLIKIDHLEAENKCLKWAVNEINANKKHCENISSGTNGQEINGRNCEQNFKENHYVGGCTCGCPDYYGKCPCFEYANDLVKIVHHLTEELQELKPDHSFGSSVIKNSYKSLPKHRNSELMKSSYSFNPLFSTNSINESVLPLTFCFENTTDSLASDKENDDVIDSLYDDHS